MAAAKKELTDNGFTYNGSTLKDPTGKPVTVTMTDPADWNDYQTDLEIIKDNLATIGISATVDKANDDAWFDNIAKGNFDAALHWTNSGDHAVRHVRADHGLGAAWSRSAPRPPATSAGTRTPRPTRR